MGQQCHSDLKNRQLFSLTKDAGNLLFSNDISHKNYYWPTIRKTRRQFRKWLQFNDICPCKGNGHFPFFVNSISIMALYENDLVKVVDELRLKGYSDDFVIKDNLMFSTGMNRGFEEEEVIIEGAYQFDITEEAFDTQNLFAVFIPEYELRGLLIDLLGMYFYMEDQTISRILRNVPLVTYTFDDDEPYIQYGLKKVLPSEFDADSDRYVLRIGFPDFPECPVGGAFSMLGFDEQTQEYVWLSTSILKYSRLKRIEYKTKDGCR